METSNKTISVNISEQQYQYLTQLASLVETVTDQHTDAETIIAKLLTRSLSNLEIGKPNTKSISENLGEPITAHIPEQNSSEEKQETKIEVKQEIKVEEDAIETTEQKASPDSILSIVSSLQGFKNKAPQVEQKPILPVETISVPMENLSLGWQRFIGQPTRNMKMAIIGNDRDTTRWAISFAHELNRSCQALYITPKLVGEFMEIARSTGANVEGTRPKETKVIHYLPETTTTWKRIISSGEKQNQYSAIFFDNAVDMQLKPQYVNELPVLTGDSRFASDVAQVYVVRQNSVNKDVIAEWTKEMDIVIICAPNKVTLIKNNFADENSMRVDSSFAC